MYWREGLGGGVMAGRETVAHKIGHDGGRKTERAELTANGETDGRRDGCRERTPRGRRGSECRSDDCHWAKSSRR